MKKILTAAAIVLVCMSACTDNSSKETTNATDSTETQKVESRANEISDSTKMLDKKLADPNSTYTPDSLK
jgi:hypothetical protein